MAYFEGFVAAVPAANKDEYQKHAAQAADFIRECGATRHVEAWGDDVPDGKTTDFKGAVQARDDEIVVFSWFEYPDKATRDAANAKMMADPRMEEIGKTMPFDGSRMIYAGFDAMIDERSDTEGTAAMGYVDGFLLPVMPENKDAYRAMATKAAPIFIAHGAIRVVEAWGDDIPDGKVTDYRRAVHAQDSENTVFSWIEWPDKQTRDTGMAQAMQDPQMAPDAIPEMPFDGKRMIYGGFAPILDK